MHSTTRPTAWCTSWMLGDEALQTRRDQAKELTDAITVGHYDKDTFLDLGAILNFEILCHRANRLKHDHPSELRESAEKVFKPAFTRAWADWLLLSLSTCLVKSINEHAYLERELQSRLILTTLNLLHVQGVTALHAQSYEQFHKNLESLFTDLQAVAGSRDDSIVGSFRRFQCSFALSATVQYAAQFKKAEPILVTLACRVTSILSGVLMAAGPALGGSINLKPCLAALDEGLRAVTHKADKRYIIVFALQEMATSASAFSMYLRSAKESQHHSLEIEFASIVVKNLQRIGLERAASLLDDEQHRDFETRSKYSPPSGLLDSVLGVFRRGPPSFDDYHYIYGILDCAAQFRSGMDDELIPPPSRLNTKMISLALDCTQPSYRWKALEYLIAPSSTEDPTARSLAAGMSSHSSERARAEFIAISQATTQESEAHARSQQRRPTILSLNPPEVLTQVNDWLEPKNSVPTITSQSNLLAPFATKQPVPRRLVGLSPDCTAAFSIADKEASVLSIRDKSPMSGHEVFTIERKEGGFIHAAISDRYLAVMTWSELLVISYCHPGETNRRHARLVASERFPWTAKCLAIHDANDRSWVAVAGEQKTSEGSRGSIAIYEVRRGNAKLELVKHDYSFGYTRSTDGVESEDILRGMVIKSITFSPEGGRLICISNNDCIFVWYLSNNMRPRYAPYCMRRPIHKGMGVQGLTSASIFYGKSGRPYLICSIWYSAQRARNGGERSFISPISKPSVELPTTLRKDIEHLDKQKPLVASAASPTGDLVAVMDNDGNIILIPLKRSGSGGLRSNGMVALDKKVIATEKVCPSAMRFRYTEASGLELFVISRDAKIVHKQFTDWRPPNESQMMPPDDPQFYVHSARHSF